MTTNTPIHETVREYYAERIKSSASCCGTDSCCAPESNLYPLRLSKNQIFRSVGRDHKGGIFILKAVVQVVGAGWS
jgi:hypothetical protein